jgi:hypothetical protein
MRVNLQACYRRVAVILTLAAIVFGGVTVSAGEKAGEERPAENSVIAFVGVNVVTMYQERVLENYVVLVQGDRIIEVGPTDHVDIPKDARRIEARGKYLMPGLIEMHGHVPTPNFPYKAEDVAFLYVANGVTTVRGMLGHPSHLEFRQRVANGEVVGPTYYLSGPAVSGNPRAWGELKTEADGAAVARKIHEAGYEAVKVHEGLAPAAYDGVMRAAAELGLLTGGHVPNDVGLLKAIERKQGTIEHLDGYIHEMVTDDAPAPAPGLFQPELVNYVDEGRLRALAEKIRDAGVGNVPTASLYLKIYGLDSGEKMSERPEMRYVPTPVLNQWVRAKNSRSENGPSKETVEKQFELNRKIIKVLQEVGAKIYLGSDSPQIFQVPGFSLQDELREMVAAGLTPFQALEAGTRVSAEFLGKFDKFGLVRKGYRADLVLLNRNPLERVRNFQSRAGVMVNGRWLSQEELQQKLDEMAKRFRTE